MNKQPHSLVRRLAALLVAATFCPLQAAPVLPQVVNGQATFSQQGNVFSITNSPNAVINWQSFNIHAGEITRFIQQSSDSAVLNRIVGQDPSRILGALQSNGHVFLINPNGILFGRDARVDVNGLTASTLGMSNADFLAGKNRFQAGPAAGQLVNQGSITTPAGGKVFLIASNVSNSGVITSPQGQVVLAAGRSVELVDSSNPDLHVVVAAPSDQAINLGQIMSQGGRVGIYGALVNQRGVVNADSAHIGANGKIVLRASRDATLEAGSLTSATGAGQGGLVTVEGERVAMTGNAAIDVSGAAGGGSVLFGGGYQGKNASMKNAQQTLFGRKATIRADATASGNGGTVVLWGDASTRAWGQISARGGPLAGNGGLVETSAKTLDVNGILVNAGARNGANGVWLLDPYDIDIVATGGFGALSDADEFVDPMTMVSINASTLSSVAPGTNIKLQATHDVHFWTSINPALGSGSLEVDAGNSIFIDAAIDTGGGALTLKANHVGYASGTGAIVVGANGSLTTGGGHVMMDATQVTLDGALSTANGNVTINGGNLVNFNQFINTGNGHLTVTANDIAFGGGGASAETGTGAMIFNVTGGNFGFGTGWTLRSANAVTVQADFMQLQGMIGASQSVRPTARFTTFTPGKDLDFSVGRDSSALQIDPAWLATLDAEHLIIGSPAHTGLIHVYSPYSGGLAKKLTLNTSGDMWISAPISMPAGIDSALELLVSGTNSIGSINTLPDVLTPSFKPGGHLAADNVSLRANNMSIGATITGTGAAGGKVTLSPHIPSGQVQVGVGATDGANMLGLQETELALISTKSLFLGNNSTQSSGLSITSGGMDFSAILAAGSKLMLGAGVGNLQVDGNLTTLGELFMQGQHIGTPGGARVKAQSIRINSVTGIGADLAPLYTETGYFAASNALANGGGVINVQNVGTLVLGPVHQNGAGNHGSISIHNTGGMSLPELDGALPNSIFTNGDGGISLQTLSPLTINGSIKNDSGPILLQAGNGGLLTIGATGLVDSISGNIDLLAGDVINNGSVITLSGNINVGATTVTGSGTYNAPGGVVTGVIPTIPQCLANPATPGCTTILKTALDACIVDPSGQYCIALLPSMASCIADPTIYGCIAVLPPIAACIADPSVIGCSAVLPSLAVCIADPTILGCSVVLPSLAACIADPAKPGCAVVLPSLAACIADPGKPGCSVVLPSLAACIADPTKPGCSVVLPPLSVCIADPTKPGCAAVLPTLATCIVTPSTPGCSAVLPPLSACIADPGKPGCSVVLPTLAVCIAAPSTAGCSVVLPALTACIADPTKPGCAVVLPSLALCTVAPSTAGCAVVLPSLAACIATPTRAGCSAVLPSLAVCVANPAAAGCSVVLPTLSACVATPTLAGCAVVLPTLAQCTASPSLQGCSVVLPSTDICTISPASALCQVISPGTQASSSPMNSVIVMTNQSIVAAAVGEGKAVDKVADKVGEKKDEKADSSSKPLGENKDVRKKTYCN